MNGPRGAPGGWLLSANVLTGLAFVTLIATEIVRSLVHRHRERVYGIGATQDIAMWGTLIGWAWCLGAIVCFLVWALGR